MKCPKCRRDMTYKTDDGTHFYFQCKCGYTIGKPTEEVSNAGTEEREEDQGNTEEVSDS